LQVAFGGSYPGTIAALLRHTYPNITQGNVASSAPLYAVVDYWQYAGVMENTIRETGMDCYNAVKVAFEEMMNKTFTQSGREEIQTAFK
jgi:hypothetical protein